MTSPNRVQTLRSAVAGQRPSTGTRTPGELYSNWPDLQLGVINAAKQAVDLLPVRFFSAAANYVIGDFVAQGGRLYRAKVAVAPGAFNAANWDLVTQASDPVVGYLPLAGGALTGPLTLAADPAAALQSATKQYVDAQVATITQPFPSGTVMVFYQPSAPPGWNKLTSQNDKALRVVSGSGGVAGGINPFSTVMAMANVGMHTLTLGEIPAGITSTGNNNIIVYPAGNSALYAPVTGAGGWGALSTPAASGLVVPFANSGNFSSVTSFSNSQNINVSSNNTSGQAHNHPISLAMQYVDVILCSKT